MLCPHLNSIRHILLFHKHPLYSYPAPQQLRLANLHHRAGFAAFAVVGRRESGSGFAYTTVRPQRRFLRQGWWR